MQMPYENVKKIKTRQDFISFLNTLRNDFKNNKNDWENNTLEKYLEAMEASVRDLDGGYKNRGEIFPEDVNWKVFAEILSTAAIYE